jgi:hypothetical protein
MKEKTKTIIGIVILVGIVILLFLGFYFAVKDSQRYYENCDYELKDGIICNHMSGAYETTFSGCSDGFIHIGEPYKEVCKEGYKE